MSRTEANRTRAPRPSLGRWLLTAIVVLATVQGLLHLHGFKASSADHSAAQNCALCAHAPHALTIAQVRVPRPASIHVVHHAPAVPATLCVDERTIPVRGPPAA